MDAKPEIETTHITGPALQATVDLLAFTTFGDSTKDPFFKAVDSALGGVLGDIARFELFEGKSCQSISVHTHGRIAAKRVVVVGGGPRNELKNPALRDIT